jgi:hypothetical protein
MKVDQYKNRANTKCDRNPSSIFGYEIREWWMEKYDCSVMRSFDIGLLDVEHA